MTDSTSSAIAKAIRDARASQPMLNAFTQIEDESSAGSTATGALTGLPIALKDLIDHAGRTTTAGSAFYRHRATTSATCVSRLEAEGGVIIGRTNLHEFAYGFSSENPHFGPVRNPWDLNTSAGGSSGGSGAAVAAGIVPVAIGTDTGGSVRVPAALCGCFGLKVTHGSIPLDGVFPLVPSIDTVGPIADSVDNLERVYRVLADDADPLPEHKPFRFGIPQPWFDNGPVSEDVSASFETAVSEIRSLGNNAREIEIANVFPDSGLGGVFAPEVSATHRGFVEHGMPYGDDVAARIESSFATTESQIAEGKAWQQMIKDRFDEAFAEVDLLITPTVGAMRKTIGENEIAGSNYRTVLSWFTSIVNIAHLPAVALPLLRSGQPPVSIQVIGPPGSELTLLTLARSWEGQGLVGFALPPNIAAQATK